MTDIFWSNNDVIFKDGDIVWKSHETDLQAIFSSFSSISSSLDLQPGLAGSVVGVSGASGSLSVSVELGSSIVEISSSSAVLGSVGVLTLLVAPGDEISDASGSLDSQPGLTGSSDGISTCSGSLLEAIQLAGSSDGVSTCSGSLSVFVELGSSIVEITGSSAALGSVGVLTLLVAPSGGVSSVSGWLGFLIFVGGEVAGVSNVPATNLDKQPGLESSTVGITILSGYLSLIPDFDAMTLFWRPQDDIIETLEWKTQILKTKDGTEQRIKIRQSPRQYFKLRVILKTNKINTQFDSIIHSWQKQTWLIPVWTEYEVHTGNINQHDTVIEIDTTFADFRNDSKAIIWKSSTEYEVIVIDTKTDSQLNLSYSVLNNFTGIKYVIPVRTAYLITSSNKERYNSEYSIVDLIFAVYDNIDIDDYVFDMNYDGLGILNVPSFMEETHVESSDGDIIITDFETGIFKVESDSNFNILTQNHIFFNNTKEACWNFRKFLHLINGRQKTILIPTFRSDVIQTEDIEVLDTFVKIENIDLTENMGFNSLRTYIGFYFSDGTLIVRKITAITEIDSSEEQIDFDADLGLSFVVEPGDCKICFVDKCRLASDKIEIQWPYAHRNKCRTNFVRIS